MNSPARGASWCTTAASWPRRRTASRSAASAPPRRPLGGSVTSAADEPNNEVADLVGKLVAPEETDGAERRRLLGRLSGALARSAGKARERGVGRGRWLADVFMNIAPRLPVRDYETLREHHY